VRAVRRPSALAEPNHSRVGVQPPDSAKAPAERRIYRIGASERAIDILDMLAEMPDSSMAQLAERLQLPRGSVFRHLRVLVDHGYAVCDPASKRYSVGPRLIYLGHVARSGLALAGISQPFLEELHDRFNETTHIGVLTGGEVVHIAVLASSHPVKMASAVGERTSAHISALGKALLSSLDTAGVKEVIGRRGMRRFTPSTIITLEGLLQELDDVRERGYAIDNEESAVGLRCVGCAIRDEGDRVVAAISVSAPSQRLSLGEAKKMAPTVREVAEAISRRLGWNSGLGKLATRSGSAR
jgi:DNA-binding IclR family transcriptional regulator